MKKLNQNIIKLEDNNPNGSQGFDRANYQKLSGLSRFFCWCSGSKLDVLEHCATDQTKMFGAGTAVFMTGVFAVISSTFALSTVFLNEEKSTISGVFICGLVGLAWGCFIFLLDRYFVSSMSKSKSKWNQFWIALPRLIIAGFIGVTIAHPLELRFFEESIMHELSTQKKARIDSIKVQYDREIANAKAIGFQDQTATISSPELQQLLDEKERFEVMVANADTAVIRYAKLVQCECNGACGTGIPGRGNACKFNERLYANAKREADANKSNWNAEIATLSATIGNLRQTINARNTGFQADADKSVAELRVEKEQRIAEEKEKSPTSLLARHRALQKLSREPNSGVWGIQLVIICLFVLIEISPILIKFLSKTGPYDDAIEKLEKAKFAENMQNGYVVRAEYKTNKDLINQMAIIQRNLMKESLEKWEEEQRKEINPEEQEELEEQYY